MLEPDGAPLNVTDEGATVSLVHDAVVGLPAAIQFPAASRAMTHRLYVPSAPLKFTVELVPAVISVLKSARLLVQLAVVPETNW